jgi:hypothetical protein
MIKRFCAAVLGGLLVISGFSAATAQTSEDMVKSNPRAQYRAIKSAMQKMVNKGGPATTAMYTDEGYDLYHCNTGSEYIGESGDDRIGGYANLAFDLIIWNSNLRKLGYPQTLWSTPLNLYEEAELKLLDGAPEDADSEWTERRARFLAKLAPPLQAYQSTKPRMKKVVVEGGCGAGEISVKIETDPKGAEVMFIPAFFYELCRAQNLNPDDTARCNRWREAIDGTLSQVAGDYIYIARWPDGTTRRGTLSFTKLTEDQTVVLRKPVR